MPKRILLLPGLVIGLLALCANAAQASPFYLTLSDGTAAVTIADGGVGDLQALSNDMIQVNTSVGLFTVTGLVTTILNGTSGYPVELRVGAMTVKSLGAGTLTATLWRYDLNPTALGLGSSVLGTSTAGATTSSFGSVAFTNGIDKTNGSSATALFNTTLPGSPTTGTAPIYGLGPGNFSLVSQLQFTFTGASAPQGINASSSLKLSNDATPVPEPTTLLLFGPGMLGLLGLGRHRRRSKTA